MSDIQNMSLLWTITVCFNNDEVEVLYPLALKIMPDTPSFFVT